MEAVSLNLSRKWRSQNFDQIVGQDLSVRMLKNSLYVGQYFPVYLFSGQRGCGKTSTARVFASALNCQELLAFQNNPKSLSIPCLLCTSCVAMSKGQHPDFIEIDGASHTGVDNMRTIIESSSFLPVMGRKRVYLIDEAHMLTKAAFNAALKILEEPPATALFILATTHPHKIIDTVRSRCFQLFFTPIVHESLKAHLEHVCKKESIEYHSSALDMIIRHSQGSARDALNILEQVRLSHAAVNQQAVLQLLGHMNDQHILDIIKVALKGSVPELLHVLNALSVEQYTADFIWQRLMTTLRALVWLKHGVNPKSLVSSIDEDLKMFAKNCSLSELHRMIEALYENEELFLKTPMQHALLELILLNVCHKDGNKNSGNDNGGAAPCLVAAEATTNILEESDDSEDETGAEVDQTVLWGRFVEQIAGLNDPILNSLFRQARFVSYDLYARTIMVEFAKDLVLFKDWFENARPLWLPLLRGLFAGAIGIDSRFTGACAVIEKGVHNRQVEKQQAPVAAHKPSGERFVPTQQQQQYKKKITSIERSNEKAVDVSDENEWKIASMLLRHFPGTITEIREQR